MLILDFEVTHFTVFAVVQLVLAVDMLFMLLKYDAFE